MKVETFLFGAVEVSPENVITFPAGLVGFENNKRYMLAHDAAHEQPTSYTLQSLEDANLAFQIIDPSALGFHYELALTDAETAMLHNPVPDELAVMLVMYKQDGEDKIGVSANIRAPLIINSRAKVGIQKVITYPRSNVTISNLSMPV